MTTEEKEAGEREFGGIKLYIFCTKYRSVSFFSLLFSPSLWTVPKSEEPCSLYSQDRGAPGRSEERDSRREPHSPLASKRFSPPLVLRCTLLEMWHKAIKLLLLLLFFFSFSSSLLFPHSFISLVASFILSLIIIIIIITAIIINVLIGRTTQWSAQSSKARIYATCLWCCMNC